MARLSFRRKSDPNASSNDEFDGVDIPNALTALSQDLQNEIDLQHLCATLATGLQNRLDVEHAAVFVKRDSLFEVLAYKGDIWEQPPIVDADDDLITSIKSSGFPLRPDTVQQLSPGGLFMSSREAKRIIPLQVSGQLLGFAAIGRKKLPRRYTDGELHAMSDFGAQTGKMLKLAMLAQQKQTSELRRQMDVVERRIARGLQQHYLPTAMPPIIDWDYTGIAGNPGGAPTAFYDFFQLDAHTLHIVIGTVMTPDFNNLVIAPAIRALVRAFAPLGSVGGAISQVGAVTNSLYPENVEISLMYGRLYLASGEFDYVSAGPHNPLLFINGHDQVIPGPTSGDVIGPKLAVYKSYNLVLKQGYTLVLHVDSSTPTDKSEEYVSNQSLIEHTFRSSDHKTAGTLATEIMRSFGGGEQAPFDNDVALVVLRRL